MARVRFEIGSRALLVQTRTHARVYVWDLFLPFVLFLLMVGAGALSLFKAPVALIGVVSMIVATKCASVRVGRGRVVITWWWGPIPYRRRRFEGEGRFVEDEGDDWSESPATTFAYVPRGGTPPPEEDGWVWCRHPEIVTSFLNGGPGVRVPEARAVREER